MAKFIEGDNLAFDDGALGGDVTATGNYAAPSGLEDTCLVIILNLRYENQSIDPILQDEVDCTYDGVSMTLAANQVENTDGHGTYIFYKLNPSTVSKTITATMNTGSTLGAGSFIETNYILLSEVDQSNPLGDADSATGSADPLQVSLSTSRGNGIIVGGANLRVAGGDNQTNVYFDDTPLVGASYTFTSYLKYITTGSKVFGYDNTSGDFSVMTACIFQDSGGQYPKTINII